MAPKGKDGKGKAASDKGKGGKGGGKDKSLEKKEWQPRGKGGDKGGEKGDKGGGKGSEEQQSSNGAAGHAKGRSKGYADMFHNLSKSTAARAGDFDPKALELLDALQEAGKLEAAFAHLAKSLDGVAREKVMDWHRYVFALLRGFDAEVYNQMKEARGRPKLRRKESKSSTSLFTTTLKATAPAFVPGSLWAGCYSDAREANRSAPGAQQGTVFQVECKTEEGESLAVTGSVEELGKWALDKAVILKSTAEASVWKSDPMKLTGGVEYKFAVLDKDKKLVRMEKLEENRKLPESALLASVAKFDVP